MKNVEETEVNRSPWTRERITVQRERRLAMQRLASLANRAFCHCQAEIILAMKNC